MGAMLLDEVLAEPPDELELPMGTPAPLSLPPNAFVSSDDAEGPVGTPCGGSGGFPPVAYIPWSAGNVALPWTTGGKPTGVVAPLAIMDPGTDLPIVVCETVPVGGWEVAVGPADTEELYSR